MAEYRKFFLKPGQKPPVGSLGKGLADGSIMFYGDDFPAYIESSALSVDELRASKVQQFKQELSAYRSSAKYSLETITDFIYTHLYITKKLKSNPPNAAVLEAELDSMNPFFEWYHGINVYKRNILKQLNAALTLADIDLIAWDFSQFDGDDPGLTEI